MIERSHLSRPFPPLLSFLAVCFLSLSASLCKMRSLPLLFLLWSVGAGAGAVVPGATTSQYCGQACSAVIGRVKFDGKPAQNPPCSRPLAIDSLFACVTRYCSPNDAISGLHYVNWTCSQEGEEHLPAYTLPIDTLPTIITAKQAKKNYTVPVVPNEEYFEFALQSTVSENIQRALHELTINRSCGTSRPNRHGILFLPCMATGV